MNGMNEAILAVAQAQQGDAIPVDIPPMTQSAPDMGKPPVTPKTKIGTVEEPQLWPEICQLIEADIANAPRGLRALPRRETGGLAGASLPGLAAVHRHVRPRAFRNHVP